MKDSYKKDYKNSEKRFAGVICSTGTRLTDRVFTYSVPQGMRDKIQIGSSVYVPFGRGNKKTEGLLVEFYETCAMKTKAIISIVENMPIVSKEGIELAYFLARETLSDYSSAFQTVLAPGGFGTYKPKIRVFYSLTDLGREAQVPKGAVRQKAVIDYLTLEESEDQVNLIKTCGATSSSLKAMVDKGWLAKSDKRVLRRRANYKGGQGKKALNPDQQRVFDIISKKVGNYLICGVTGSGKTEIYMQLVEQALSEGKEAIVLVPEISLTPQTIERFEKRFGKEVAILHSRLSNAERYEEWEKIKTGRASIAIGARSAIFAPFKNLGLIVIDEEHENTYVSEKNPKYHTYDVAKLRAEYHACSLVSGSATPSMESLYRAEKGEMVRLDLPSRVGNRPLPEIEIIDMREELKKGNRTMFSEDLYRAMLVALEKKEQIILFLNKRGHTSFVFCRSCGYVYRCDACDVSMTYHKYKNRLVCHYCGREKRAGGVCPRCGSKAIKDFGAGTEQLEEEVKKLFPDARVKRADADTMGKKGSYEDIYNKMMAGEIDILLGTQMIAKGFDFPKVSVVGIVSADISLNLPDLRAREKTFQLLTQVAGRAGRGDTRGKVFVQTYKPDNPAILAASNHDVDAFYKSEKDIRLMRSYTPITRDLQVRLAGADRRAVFNKGLEIKKFIEKEIANVREGTFEGPAPSVIERIDRKYRFAIMIRGKYREDLRNLGQALIDRFPTSREINIILTLDPISIF